MFTMIQSNFNQAIVCGVGEKKDIEVNEQP